MAVEAKDIQPSAVVRHERTERNYQIAALGKIRTPSGWIMAARYMVAGQTGGEEFYRRLDDFGGFVLVRAASSNTQER